GRRRAGRRRGQDCARPDLLANKSGHELIAVKALELALELCEECLLVGGQPSWNPGRLEQAEAENPVGTRACVGERDEPASRIADQVEPPEVLRLRESIDGRQL